MTDTLKDASFTSHEQAAADEFEKSEAVAVRECFDCFDLESIQSFSAEFGEDACRAMLKEHAGMLNEWYFQVDRLLGDALTCTSESTSYSRQAIEYVSAQVDAFHRARQGFEYAVTSWTLGLDISPMGNYPPPTRSLNLPMQSLTAE